MEKITVFRTEDGKTFPSKELATKHEARLWLRNEALYIFNLGLLSKDAQEASELFSKEVDSFENLIKAFRARENIGV